jgi:hypothetical protein
MRTNIRKVLCTFGLIEHQGIPERLSILGPKELGPEKWGDFSNGLVNTLRILGLNIEIVY